MLDGVGASIVRLDIFKKNNVDRVVAGADVAGRLERGELPNLKKLVWVHAGDSPDAPYHSSPASPKARLEAATAAAGVDFDAAGYASCRFRTYTVFALED